jgi:K+/H+ antiporter YhaU regulatory subunit KhtT
MKFKNASKDKKKLIQHQVTRTIFEKLNREEIISMFALIAMEARVTKDVMDQMIKNDVDVLKTYIQITDMFRLILTNIGRRENFDWEIVIGNALKDENLEYTMSDVSDVLLSLAARICV